PIGAMINHNTNEVFFDNLKIPADSLIGEEGKGFRYILDGMNAERILVAQECIGDGRWLLKKGVDYAKERVVFDKPIGQNQGVQFPLARAYAELEAADMICRRAAALFDAGKECGADANMAKLLASEATWHAADATFQTFGGFAFAKEYDIERKWREVRLYQTAPISTNLILNDLGQLRPARSRQIVAARRECQIGRHGQEGPFGYRFRSGHDRRWRRRWGRRRRGRAGRQDQRGSRE